MIVAGTGGDTAVVQGASLHDHIAPDVASSLPPGSREVMEYIRDAGGLSTGEVAERLGMSKPAAASRLRALRDAGYVEWVGKSPRDPRSYWRLASE
jgi:ATP-dependent DNA helicase RecG